MLASSGPSTGQTCGLVLIFAVLLQTICVAVTFLYFTNELQQLRESYSKNSFDCFTKGNLFLEDPDPNYSEDGDPCWQVKWQLSRFIKKMLIRNRLKEPLLPVKDTYPTEQDAEENPIPKAAAHLTANRERKTALNTQNSSFRSSFGFKIDAWDSSRRTNSFLHRLQLRNGELIIPHTGFYYVYSQTYFRFHEPEGVEPDSEPGSDSVRNPKQMVQYISKYTNYPDPIPLMKSARTSCWSKNTEYGLYSIYQGGVFHLKSNDRIFVSVSNEDLVVLDKEASFFGAFRVA